MAPYEALMKCYPLTLDDLPDELWKPIPDYEEFYHVSNYGRIKRFYKTKPPRIFKPYNDKDGYLRVTLSKNNKLKNFRVSRLVATCFIPNPESKPQVNHRDGNKLNNFVENLEWATSSENNQHAFDTGLKKSGEEHYHAKLTNEQAQYVRANPDNLTTTKMAKMFSVTHRVISQIQLGESYRNAGGVVRDKKSGGLPKIPDDIRNQIKAEYQAGVRGCGSHALAKKYGIGQTTVARIVHEG